MIIRMQKNILIFLVALIFPFAAKAQLIQQSQLEKGALLPGHTSLISSPFGGVAAYGNGDGVETTVQLAGVPGLFRLDIRGASSNASAAGISAYIGDSKIGGVSFTGTAPSVQSINFKLADYPSAAVIRLVLETDTGSNDTFLDWFELYRVGDIPPPPPPVLPSGGSYESGIYRNLFAELGITQAEIDARVQAVYDQLFHSPDRENEALFIPVGNDMAYIWDVGNNDVRSEGMSYGMMMAVQMGRKDDFDKLWKWAHTHMLNTEGDMKGYFAWQVSTSGNILDKNPAPDGEEYFATALFFASHLWGDGDGIFNYSAQANQILRDMYNNGQTRYANGGQLEYFSLFNHDEMQIVFSPATPSDRNWTDPSYHLPAFYELWARWADNNNAFWAELAETSRAFWKTTAHPETGLSPDYAYFDGRPHGDFQHWKDTFQYDAWRTIGNAAMDFAWWQKDPWQTQWANRLQAFFYSEGVDSYSSLYELNGVPYENNADHSPGLVAMNAVASLASDQSITWDFVRALWETPVPTGKWRYYDGCLYMFGMLATSGKYRIICPQGECDYSPPPSCEETNSCSSNSAPLAEDDTAQTSQESTVNIDVLANDVDPDNDVLTISSVSQAGSGNVIVNGSSLSYTPDTGFSGTDSFSYIVSDGLLTDSASVTVTVQAAGGDDGSPGDDGSTRDDQLLGRYEFEDGVISPSYRQPISSPYSGAILYGNGEKVSFDVGQLPAGSYTVSVSGSSSNTTEAGISLSIGGVEVGNTSFNSTTRQTKTIEFELTSPASGVEFILRTDVGRNDTLLDWFELYSGSDSDSDGDDGNPDGGTGDNDGAATCDAPFVIQAEDYQSSYDTTQGNSGASYRSDNVDIQTTSDTGGGYNVGWTANGEWLEYATDLAAGDYQLEIRVASEPGGGSFTIDANSAEVVPPTTVSSTGGWQQWTTRNAGVVSLAANSDLRINIQSGNFNINWIQLTPANCFDDNSQTGGGSQGSEVMVEAEDYMNYHDTTAGNTGGAYRSHDVDIETTADSSGSYNVGWIEAGEWLEYNVSIEEGVYIIQARVASNSSGGAFSLLLDGEPLITEQTVPGTGGWQAWQTIDSETVYIPAGNYTLRIAMTGSYFNLNWLRILPQ